jgi:predicted nucleotidyltransferase
VAAVHVQVDADLTIPVAPLAGIAVLKLFAWHDRQTNDKDALDLHRVISNYADAGNFDRLYDEEFQFLEQASSGWAIAMQLQLDMMMAFEFGWISGGFC